MHAALCSTKLIRTVLFSLLFSCFETGLDGTWNKRLLIEIYTLYNCTKTTEIFSRRLDWTINCAQKFMTCIYLHEQLTEELTRLFVCLRLFQTALSSITAAYIPAMHSSPGICEVSQEIYGCICALAWTLTVELEASSQKNLHCLKNSHFLQNAPFSVQKPAALE